MTPLRGLWGVLLVAALAGSLVLWPDAAPAWRRLLTMDAVPWSLGIAGMVASHALRAARLHAEWGRHLGVDFVESWRVTVWHHAAVNLLPMRAGELGYPWLLRRRWHVPLIESASSLLWMRTQDALVLMGLAMLLLAAATLPAAAAFGFASLVTLGWLLLAASSASLAGSWAAAVEKAGGRWPRARSWLLAVCRGGARSGPSTWFWCLANWLVKLTTVAALLAMVADAPALAAVAGALAGEVAAVLPVHPPGGFGPYEAAVTMGILSLHAAPWTELLAAALSVHLFVVTVACTCALLAWALPGARRLEAPEPWGAQP